MRMYNRLLLFLVLPLMLLPVVGRSDDKADSDQAKLDQMMAPVALYPDSLLSQILMASTYPDQVAEAAKWSKANPDTKGDAAVKAVQSKSWDPSVASLVAFPQVLAMMGDKPDWVKEMGDAFLAEPDKVMDTVQGLRKKAKDAGNLKTTEQQKVTEDTSNQQTIIKIEPADPQVVYVPAYNPTVVYGTWWWPAYPPFYWPPPPGYGFATGVMTGIGFGVGIAVTNCIWGGFNWYHHDVNINVNKYNNININHKLDVNKNTVSWKHNSINRQGAPYADSKSRQTYSQKLQGSDKRQDYRGRDSERQQAMQTLQKQGIDPAAERSKLTGSSGQQVRDKVSDIDRQRAASPGGSFGGGRMDGGGLSGQAQNAGSRLSGGGGDRGGAGGQAFSGLGDRDGGRLGNMRGEMSSGSFGGGGFGGRGGGGFGGGGFGGGGLGGGGGRLGGMGR